MRTVAFGQFVPGRSTVHALDPRTKLLGTLAYAGLLLLAHNVWATAACGAFTAATLGAARPPWRPLWRGLAPVSVAVAVTLLAQAFLRPAPHAWHGSWLAARDHALAAGLAGAVRLWLLAWQSAVTTLTTEPFDLVGAAERLAAPLERAGVPVAEGALMAVIALRFIPILFDEAQRVSRAQTARGAGSAAGWRHRWQALMALLVPLVVGAFRRADELAMALYARGYPGSGRGRWRRMRWGVGDAVAATGVAALAVGVLLASRYGR